MHKATKITITLTALECNVAWSWSWSWHCVTATATGTGTGTDGEDGMRLGSRFVLATGFTDKPQKTSLAKQ